MAKKTVLLNVLKYAPKSVEMAKVLDLAYKAEAKEEKVSNFYYVDVDMVPINDFFSEDTYVIKGEDSQEVMFGCTSLE